MYIITRNDKEYILTIGCEIHVQINSKSKLFSRSKNGSESSPNENVSFIDMAMPGMLPIINEEAIIKTIKTGIAINGKINKKSLFDRKNYFYPDLPQSYQISQYNIPIVEKGYINILDDLENEKKININRIHIEQDAGKLIHDMDKNKSFIDLNRAGTPLMEIVSEPEISSPDEAVNYLKKIKTIIKSIDSSNCDMEKGNLRCDANISVRLKNDSQLGTRCEIKNLNSFKNIANAIIYEANRQVDILENGGKISQETRLFDPISGETKSMRSKEDSMDYRYFPDPDLPPLVITEELINEIKKSLPKLPDEKIKYYIEDLNLTKYDANIIGNDNIISSFFDQLIANKCNVKLATTWLTSELFGRLNKLSISLENSPVTANSLSKLIKLIEGNNISGKIAKNILDEMIVDGSDPEKIMKEKNLVQITDEKELDRIINQILSANSDKVEQYRNGKDKLFGFFVGQVMKESKGKANPQKVNIMLKDKLK